jgi:hypothetical protein
MVAKRKFKEDGRDLYKQWGMCFNLILRKKPYHYFIIFLELIISINLIKK